MDTLTSAEMAILTLLAEAPRHGYEIETLLDERGMREWTEIGFSSIYFLLKKLEARELIAGRTAERRNPKSRNAFAITEAGRALLAQETLRALAVPQPLHTALLLGLANWPAVEAEDAFAALRDRSAALAATATRLASRRAAQAPLPAFADAMFDYSLTMIEAERSWLAQAERLLGETTMDKIDFRKELKTLYNPPAGRFEVVDVPAMNFFMADGEGDPNTATTYREAVEALYAASYTLKFMAKKALSRDYVVPPLEGLWWAEDMTTFTSRDKGRWSWTMMIMIPDFIDAAMAEQAIAAAAKKKELPGLARLRVENLDEGRSVQTMHIGSYDEEGPVLKRLHAEFLPQNGLVETGKHHEIYLGDPRKTAPEKLKTILRQPVKAG